MNSLSLMKSELIKPRILELWRKVWVYRFINGINLFFHDYDGRVT